MATKPLIRPELLPLEPSLLWLQNAQTEHWVPGQGAGGDVGLARPPSESKESLEPQCAVQTSLRGGGAEICGVRHPSPGPPGAMTPGL